MKAQLWLTCFLFFAVPSLAPAEQSDIVFFGDSLINERYRLVQPVVRYFEGVASTSGAGYCSLVGTNGTADLGMIYLRPKTGWLEVDQDSSSIGLNISHAVSFQSGARVSFRVSSQVEEVEIYFLEQPGGGSFIVKDGRTQIARVETDSTETASGLFRLDWSPTSFPGSLDLVIENPRAAGVILGGVNFKTFSNGVRVHKIGNGGLTARQAVAVDRQMWVDALAGLDPEVFCVLLGTNDFARDVEPDDFKVDIAELVSRVREAKPSTEIMLMSPSDNGLSSRDYELSDYRDVLVELCIELDLRFMDFKEVLGDYETANGLGLYADAIHPNAEGGALMADAWWSLVHFDGASGLHLLDVLDGDAVVAHSDLEFEWSDDGDLVLSWRRLPGLSYALCKSRDLNAWDESPIEDDYPRRAFEMALTDEENSFFKLKMTYPDFW